MGIEKQIQIDLKEGEKLTTEDIEDISVINNFLYKHETTQEEENENTIKDFADEDIKIIWGNLKIKFENRIAFINSDPNPEDYFVFSEQNEFADKQREKLTTQNGAIKNNKEALKQLLEDIQNDLPPDDIPSATKYLESILQNFDQLKAFEYNAEIEEKFGYGDVLITNEDIENSILSYKKYDVDQKRLLEHLRSSVYMERLKREFNCSDEVAIKHVNTRIANCCVGYNLDEKKDSTDAHFSPYKDDAKFATILPPKRENTGNRYVFFHEIGGHRITNAEGVNGESSGGLSDYAKRELLNSYEELEQGVRLSGMTNPGYFKNLSERYARKVVLDFELEDLGIKAYETPFTREVFDQLMECYQSTINAIDNDTYDEKCAKNNHLLSKNSIQFIESTKKDFQIYEKIFNNIA